MKLNQKIARRLLQYMEVLGHSPAAICKSVGIKYVIDPNEEVSYSGDALEQLWMSCESLSGLDDIGFHFGQHLSIESLGTLGMLLQHVATVGQGLEAAAEFIPLVSDFINIKLETDETELTISIIPDCSFKNRFPVRTKHACLLTVSLIIKMYAVLTMKKPKLIYAAMPEEVKNRQLISFCYPHNIEVHPQHYVIKCTRAILDLSIVFANARMKSIIEEVAQQEMKETRKEWTSKVEDELSKRIGRSALTLSEISQALGLSNRSLQRRLRDEQMSFQQVVTTYKTHIAKALLSRAVHPKAVATKLGYTDVSSFYKSFKQWTGQTVQDYVNSKLK